MNFKLKINSNSEIIIVFPPKDNFTSTTVRNYFVQLKILSFINITLLVQRFSSLALHPNSSNHFPKFLYNSSIKSYTINPSATSKSV